MQCRSSTHILVNCQSPLGILTVNALAAANRILVPIRAEYLPAKGLEQPLQIISKVRRQINPKLKIDVILLIMVTIVRTFPEELPLCCGKIKAFDSKIIHSVQAKEINAKAKSILAYDTRNRV